MQGLPSVCWLKLGRIHRDSPPTQTGFLLCIRRWGPFSWGIPGPMGQQVTLEAVSQAAAHVSHGSCNGRSPPSHESSHAPCPAASPTPCGLASPLLLQPLAPRSRKRELSGCRSGLPSPPVPMNPSGRVALGSVAWPLLQARGLWAAHGPAWFKSVPRLPLCPPQVPVCPNVPLPASVSGSESRVNPPSPSPISAAEQAREPARPLQ